MGIYSLPPEIIVIILHSVEWYPPDLYNICLVKPFHAFATKLLYSNPGLSMNDVFPVYYLACLVRTVVQYPHLAALIRNFTFDSFYDYSHPTHPGAANKAVILNAIELMNLQVCCKTCWDVRLNRHCSAIVPALVLAHAPNVSTAFFAPHDTLANVFSTCSTYQRLRWWQVAFPNHRCLKTLILRFKPNCSYNLADIACILELQTLQNLEFVNLKINERLEGLDTEARFMLRECMSPVKRLSLQFISTDNRVLSMMLACFAALREFRLMSPASDCDSPFDFTLGVRHNFPLYQPLLSHLQEHKHILRNLTITERSSSWSSSPVPPSSLVPPSSFSTFANDPIENVFVASVGFLWATGHSLAAHAPTSIPKLIIDIPITQPLHLGKLFNAGGFFDLLVDPANFPHLREICLDTINPNKVLGHIQHTGIMNKIRPRNLLIYVICSQAKHPKAPTVVSDPGFDLAPKTWLVERDTAPQV